MKELFWFNLVVLCNIVLMVVGWTNTNESRQKVTDALIDSSLLVSVVLSAWILLFLGEIGLLLPLGLVLGVYGIGAIGCLVAERFSYRPPRWVEDLIILSGLCVLLGSVINTAVWVAQAL